MRYGHEWRPYVPVGQKRANARRFADKLAKKQKRDRQPVEIQGRKIAKSFWGKAWCDHLESLSDYANRLPRGATYVRNGSVVDLVIQPGKVDAVVAGSDPYQITISINKLNKKIWDNIKKDCSSAIDSLIDLLGGRLSDGVMQRLTNRKSGCFPFARQIEMDCSCPDWSMCCKHIAAVMYAIGSRLDSEPELLFLLRGVNQEELISQAVSKENLDAELTDGSSSDLENEDLGSIFGIELDSSLTVEAATKSKPKTAYGMAKPRQKAAAKKKPPSKTAATKKETGAKKKAATKERTGLKKKTKAKKTNRAKPSTKSPAKQAVTKRKAKKAASIPKPALKKKKKTSATKSTTKKAGKTGKRKAK